MRARGLRKSSSVTIRRSGRFDGVLANRSENQMRRETVRKKNRRSTVDAAGGVIARLVRKFFLIWQRKMRLREAYRCTKYKQNKRVVRNTVVTMVSRKRLEALVKIDRSLRRVVVRNSMTRWIRVTQFRRKQMNRAKIIHKEMSRKRVIHRMRQFAKRRSETRCAAAIVCQLHQRRVLDRVLKSARLHYKFRIASDIAERERKRRSVRTMKLERIRRDVNRRRKRVRFENWKAFVEDVRLQKEADIFWARHAALKVIKHLQENVFRERQAHEAIRWHRMRSKHRALLAWYECTRESVLTRRAKSFWIASRVQFMMNRWKTETKRMQMIRTSAFETIRIRRVATLRLWRCRTERRVALRRALRIWKYGSSVAARLVLSTMKSRRTRRRDALIHFDGLINRNLRDSTRLAFSRWKSFVHYGRKRRRFLLSTTFWLWDQYVVECRLSRYFSNQSRNLVEKVTTPIERTKRKRYTEEVYKLSPILELK